jgi:hypothetical protein
MSAVATTTYPLPTVVMVRELLGMLFDGLIVKVAGKLDLSPKGKPYFAVYVNDQGAPAALVVCDIPFAANSGAALSMLPPNIAKECVKSGVLTEVMVANLREVMNICTRLVLHDGSPHIRLDAVCPAAQLPPAPAAIAAGPKGRIDFEIGLGKYGGGMLAVLVL